MKRALVLLLIIAALGVGWFVATNLRPPAIEQGMACPAPTYGAVQIPGGAVTPGEGGIYAEEAHGAPTQVTPFWLDRYEVTNRQFAEFVATTNYVTAAEQYPDPADHPGIPADLLVPGSAVFTQPDQIMGGNINQWWQFVDGADWQHPFGPGSDIDGLEDHPVVHLTQKDAAAYAAWKGGRLPTEAEWEWAARGGTDTRFPWGDKLVPSDQHMANIWHGIFPVLNEGQDGFHGIAPVGCYPANRYGLHDMIGNVWEITAARYNADRRLRILSNEVTIKGGSFLCAANYCARYRPAARHPQDRDMGTNHIGFRVAYDQDPSK